MLQIKVQIRNSNNDVYMWIDWHEGETAPGVLCRNVVEVQAYGDELDRIARYCSGLPTIKDYYTNSVMRWFGDHAKWIAANIVGCK